MANILIVEDEAKIADLVQKYLQSANYTTHCLANGAEVVPWVMQNTVDLILLDWMLPGKDGIEVCKAIRQISDLPIIMLTAKVEEIDRLLGLELGVDDYICKPFSPREVVARVKAVLRRCQTNQSNNALEDDLTLDQQRMLAVFSGREVGLTLVEFNLLSLLYKQPSRVFTRDQLMGHIYQDYRVVSERTIDSHIKKLRKKMEVLAPEHTLIHAVYGVGYKYEQNAL
jgi:two-component system response regulator BaeR